MTMYDPGVLDLGLDPRYAMLAQAPTKRMASHGALLAFILVLGIALLCGATVSPRLFAGIGYGGKAPPVRISLDHLREVSAMTVDDKSQILVEGPAAQQRNAEIPVSALPVERVAALKFGMVDGSAYATALRCLTQTVYYEAANEPLQGRRAVAQVVLNRMRHPAYPNNVCGVVYQGVERQTGCQFSFTCDGSLLRTPVARLWNEAQAVAQAALGGYVETSVGTATHYHADYVLPKWAFSLAKIEQLGRHIFYRFNGNWGRSAAFNIHYSGIERIPMIDFAALRLKAVEGSVQPGELALDNGLTVPPDVTDRHAPTDLGGRLDVTKVWRLAIPDPVAASSRYRQALDGTAGEEVGRAGLAAADPPKVTMAQ